jgi:hypothetical protein
MALGDGMFCRRNTGFLGSSTLTKTIAVIRHARIAIGIPAGKAQQAVFFGQPMKEADETFVRE